MARHGATDGIRADDASTGTEEGSGLPVRLELAAGTIESDLIALSGAGGA